MRNIKNIQKTAILLALILFSGQVIAQTTDGLGSFTPYSIFGLGDIIKPGTAFNKGMGGIGVGVRDSRSINYLNPASISERDSLSFMLDFGMEQKNFYLFGNNTKTAYNAFNMQHLIITFPIYRKSAMVVGITPYSSVGYKFEETEKDPVIVAEMGDVKYQRYGTGGISRLFAGGSVKLFKNMSLGAEGIYYFGTIDRYSNILFNTVGSYRKIKTGMDYVVGSFSGKLGLQYTQNLTSDMNLTLGATYQLKSKLKGDYTRYSLAVNSSAIIDTVTFNTSTNTQIEIPAELAIGFSLRKSYKWMIGADYVRQDWRKVSFTSTPGVNFNPSLSNTFKIGFEYTPNRYDVRYYLRRVTYKGGAYYEKSYISVGGNQVNSAGLTLGASFPIYKGYNSVGIAIDMGQRGSLKNNMVKENYLMFIINIGLHDNSWFLKYKYY